MPLFRRLLFCRWLSWRVHSHTLRSPSRLEVDFLGLRLALRRLARIALLVCHGNQVKKQFRLCNKGSNAGSDVDGGVGGVAIIGVVIDCTLTLTL